MGFKHFYVTATLYNADGSVAYVSRSEHKRENQHWNRPAQGSRQRKRMKRRLRGKAKP